MGPTGLESLLEHFIFTHFLGGGPPNPPSGNVATHKYSHHQISNPPFTNPIYTHAIRPSRLVYWLNGRWFLQIPVVDRDSWNLYPLYPLFPCSDFVSQMWGGGVMFFSHFMLFPTFLEKKSGNTKQLFLI